MGYEINWSANAGDPVLTHPLYQKYADTPLGQLLLPNVQNDLAGAIAAKDTAAVINYLSWVIRCIQLTL
jgi:hypothetical protein